MQNTIEKINIENQLLIYGLDELINLYMQEQEEDNTTQIFMCCVAIRIAEPVRTLIHDFIKNSRPSFNNWVTINYTDKIICAPQYDTYLTSIEGFNRASLNNIKLRWLNHCLETLKKNN